MNIYCLNCIYQYIPTKQSVILTCLNCLNVYKAGRFLKWVKLYDSSFLNPVYRDMMTEQCVASEDYINLKILMEHHGHSFGWGYFLYVIGYYGQSYLFKCLPEQFAQIPQVIYSSRPVNRHKMVYWYSSKVNPTWSYQMMIQGSEAGGYEKQTYHLRIQSFKMGI